MAPLAKRSRAVKAESVAGSSVIKMRSPGFRLIINMRYVRVSMKGTGRLGLIGPTQKNNVYFVALKRLFVDSR